MRLDGRDLAADEQDVGIVEHRFLTLGVGDEVRRQVALVELHALRELELDAERVGLVDGHDTVLADLVDRVGDDFADRRVGGRDGGDVGDVSLVVDVLRLRLDRLDGAGHGLLDAALDPHRVGAGGDVAHADRHHRLSQHRGGGGAVTSDVVGLRRHFLDELGAHVLEGIVELDLLGDRDTVVGDRRGAVLLVEHDVATLRAERHLDGVGELVHARLERAARLVAEFEDLCHVVSALHLPTMASTSRLERISRSSPSIVTSVPPYFEYRTVSPTLMSSGEMLAAVVAPTAGADGEDRTLLWLLLGGVGDHEARRGALLGLVGLHDDSVIQRLQVHWCMPPLACHCGFGRALALDQGECQS